MNNLLSAKAYFTVKTQRSRLDTVGVYEKAYEIL